MPVFRLGGTTVHGTGVGKDGGKKAFRACIEERTGAGCAAIYDAVVAERAMRARLDAGRAPAEPSGSRRRAPI